jgi:hypothetical protein
MNRANSLLVRITLPPYSGVIGSTQLAKIHETKPENIMNSTYNTSSVRLDNVLSILVIVAVTGCAGFAAIASAVAPLAA